MAELVNLVTWADEDYVTPQDDAIVYESAIGVGGVYYGCTVTIKDSSTLHITAGHGVLCGRKFTIFDGDIPVQLSSSGDLLGRLYLSVDLSNTSAPAQLLVETGSSLTPPIQEDNINITNGIYQINMATFNVSPSVISGIQNVFPVIDRQGGSVSGLIATEEASPATEAHRPGEGILYNGELYVVEDTIAIGDALTPGTNIINSTVMGAMYGMAKGNIFPILASGWVLNSATNLYEYTLSLTRIYSPTPSVDISGSAVGVAATDEQVSAYGSLKQGATYVETDDNTLHLFAAAAPSVDFYILVKGVA